MKVIERINSSCITPANQRYENIVNGRKFQLVRKTSMAVAFGSGFIVVILVVLAVVTFPFALLSLAFEGTAANVLAYPFIISFVSGAGGALLLAPYWMIGAFCMILEPKENPFPQITSRENTEDTPLSQITLTEVIEENPLPQSYDDVEEEGSLGRSD